MIHPELIDGVLYTLILALASTSLALILFNYLIKMATALFASSVTYLIPLVAVLWGWVDGERLTALQVLGGFVLLIGVILIYRKEKSTRA
jgi:drug/metabolite transporter (DMT)-like permease